MGSVMLQQVTLAIAMVLEYLLTFYSWIVIIAVLITWVNPDPYNPIVRFLRGVTEPVFYQIRRWMPFVVISGIDLSPIVVLLLIRVLLMVVVVPLRALGDQFGALSSVLAIG
jgi:YggT family protein